MKLQTTLSCRLSNGDELLYYELTYLSLKGLSASLDLQQGLLELIRDWSVLYGDLSQLETILLLDFYQESVILNFYNMNDVEYKVRFMNVVIRNIIMYVLLY